MNLYRDKMKWECGPEYFCSLHPSLPITMRMIGWGGDILWIFEVGWEEWSGPSPISDPSRNPGVGSLRVIFVSKCGARQLSSTTGTKNLEITTLRRRIRRHLAWRTPETGCRHAVKCSLVMLGINSEQQLPLSPTIMRLVCTADDPELPFYRLNSTLTLLEELEHVEAWKARMQTWEQLNIKHADDDN